MSGLLANPFARAAAGDPRPPTFVRTLALWLLRAVLAVALVAAATVPFAILIGLFTDGARGNGWALAGGLVTVALTAAMGAGRRKPSPGADPPT